MRETVPQIHPAVFGGTRRRAVAVSAAIAAMVTAVSLLAAAAVLGVDPSSMVGWAHAHPHLVAGIRR